VRKGRNADLAKRVKLHLCEYSVTQLRYTRYEDARDGLRDDQAANDGDDGQGGVVTEPVDQPAVQVRNSGVRELGENQANQREHHPSPEIRPALRPEIRKKSPQGSQRRRAIALFDGMRRHPSAPYCRRPRRETPRSVRAERWRR